MSSASPSSSSFIPLNGKLGSSRLKVPVHIEVEISPSCALPEQRVVELVKASLSDQCPVFSASSYSSLGGDGATALQCSSNKMPIEPTLQSIVQSISISDLMPGQRVSFWQAELHIHAYRLSDEPPGSEYLDSEGDGEEQPIAEQTELPNQCLNGLWESIILSNATKMQLLSFCCASITFAAAGIDSNLVSWNKMVLLHGPPGTGKTSLCKALAQKVLIRHSNRFHSGVLFEVNCHSLFSKWFSESGKLVMKVFSHISDAADDDSCLVILLIDEVESIAAARSLASKAGEPGDAIRVVNAVLTSLDTLRRRNNVLVLCTSNMRASLDEAFLDRLDLCIYMGQPNLEARYQILYGCIQELVDKGIVVDDLQSDIQVDAAREALNTINIQNFSDENSSEMLTPGAIYVSNDKERAVLQIASLAEGLSGRALRKLPIRAYASFLQRPQVLLSEFMEAFRAIIGQDAQTKSS